MRTMDDVFAAIKKLTDSDYTTLSERARVCL